MSLPSHNSDDLLILAADEPLVPPPPREAHFAPTLRVLRRRRRWRRAMYALSLAGCYIAGAATLAMLRPASAGGQPVAVTSPSGPDVPSTPFAPTGPVAQSSPSAQTQDSAVATPKDHYPIAQVPVVGIPAVKTPSDAPHETPVRESAAGAETQPVEIVKTPVVASRFASYCALGDLNLMQRRDPEAASRAYRLALRFATPDERAWAATDGTWLLRAINLADFTNTVSATITPSESDDASLPSDIRS